MTTTVGSLAADAIAKLDETVAPYAARGLISSTEFFDAFLEVRLAVRDLPGSEAALELLDRIVATYSGREAVSRTEFFDAFLDIRTIVSAL